MKTRVIFGVGLILILAFCQSQTTSEIPVSVSEDELIFESGGAVFAPIIRVSPGAQIIWTWDDNTSSASDSPVKVYGIPGNRINKLKVIPWSALKSINIGYDALDGGSDTVQKVENQNVSKVRNLKIVAPYLTVWCSSYNPIDSLDFSDFINLEVVECYSAGSLKSIGLKNTPKLRRLCLEACNLDKLDVSGCSSLEDIRGALNHYPDIIFPENIDPIWHICVRDNPQISNRNLFNDMSRYKNLFELFIWNTNQSGAFSFKTNTNKPVDFQAANNHYTSLDLEGALQNPGLSGNVDFSGNLISSVNVAKCLQIDKLNLSDNKLSQAEVDKIFIQLDELNTDHKYVDLRNNSAPSGMGLTHIANLVNRSWTVLYDKQSNAVRDNLFINSFCIFPNPAKTFISLQNMNGNLQNCRISLCDLNGRNQKTLVPVESSSHTVRVNLDKFPSGVFLLRIVSDKHIYLQKIIH